jgi:hypothetical protein
MNANFIKGSRFEASLSLINLSNAESFSLNISSQQGGVYTTSPLIAFFNAVPGVFRIPCTSSSSFGPVTDIKDVMVTQVFSHVGNTVTYEYDFGDGWMHHLELVEIYIRPIDEVLPQIIEGENACPPEDCGGTYGYKKLKEVLLNPKHTEYKSTKIWVGAKFDPTYFDMNSTQRNLKNLAKLIQVYEEGF